MKVRYTPGAENLMFFVLDRSLYAYQAKKQELRHYLEDTDLPEDECNKVMGEMFDKYDNTTDAMYEIMKRFGGIPIGMPVDPELISEKGWEILKNMAEKSISQN